MEESPDRDGGDARPAGFLRRLADGLAHEIKNPLSTMAINLALLQEEWERAGSARNPDAPEHTPRERRSLKRVRTMQREVMRLEHILEEFLHYARGGEVNRKPEDISRIVGELIDFVEPEIGRAGIRHHLDLAMGLPLVLVDEDRIKQAVLNIFVNARQAMPEGGELIVRVRRVGNELELSITDTGIGMSPEALERCFEEYWSDKKGGTGLGLATAHRIIREHGGSMKLISEQGRGTSVAIYLPLAVELAGRGGKVDDDEPVEVEYRMDSDEETA
jgi:two-component system, NtrC family, sensor histidine kinase HydH